MLSTPYTFTEVLLIGHFVLNLFFAVRVIYSKRSSSVALAWLVILFVVPYLGTLAYILVGEPRLGNKREKRIAEIVGFYNRFSDSYAPLFSFDVHNIPRRFARLSQLGKSKTGFGLGADNYCQLLDNDGDLFDAVIEDINQAEHVCLLMFYIIDAQGRVVEVLEALMAAAERGVTCQVMVDDVGSGAFIRSTWPQTLQNKGIKITRSLPVGLLKTLFVRNDLRNHRKLLIVDHQIAYTGSYNLVDPRYFKQDSGVGEWIDAMMRCEGAVAQLLSGVFYADWAVENDDNLRATQQTLATYLEGFSPEQWLEGQKNDQYKSLLQVIPSAPDQNGYVVYETILCALHSALDRVIITTPYFVPDEMLLTALMTAAKRGVKVTIILPKKIDSWLASYASRAYYQSLLEAGVELAMFTGGLLHTKTVMVDNHYAIFGTVNMDMRSFYLNMEVSLAIYDQATVGTVVELQERYLRQCEEVDLSVWQRRPILNRFIERCVRLLSPLL